MDYTRTLVLAGAGIVSFVIYNTETVQHWLFSPLKSLKGPESESAIFGNFRDLLEAGNIEKWAEQYGHTYAYHGPLGSYGLLTMDTRALHHILTHSDIYQKPANLRWGIGQFVGKGLLVVEGDEHRLQRRVMNPAFGPVQIRELTPVFVEKSLQLRDIWVNMVSESENGKVVVDAMSWLSQATLDIIGLSGFNYQFNALGGQGSELLTAFKQMFHSGQGFPLLPFLQGLFPPFRLIKTKQSRAFASSHETMNKIGSELIADAKDSSSSSSAKARDLLSLLVRANMAQGREGQQQMTDKAILAQISTFLVAGHETTATGVTWALYALARAPQVRTKLRAELLAASLSEDSGGMSMDDLGALPYLDSVVREVLRLHPPLGSTIREAACADEIPVGEAYVDRHGVERRSIKVAKGDAIFIPIAAMNRSKAIWGEDAAEFRPERYDIESLQGTQAGKTSVPGVYGNLLTFLHGPRACIGYKFALVEMKAMLAVIVRNFDFELGIPHADDVEPEASFVQRPKLKSRPEGGNQLPIILSLAGEES